MAISSEMIKRIRCLAALSPTARSSPARMGDVAELAEAMLELLAEAEKAEAVSVELNAAALVAEWGINAGRKDGA